VLEIIGTTFHITQQSQRAALPAWTEIDQTDRAVAEPCQEFNRCRGILPPYGDGIGWAVILGI
jgi:hypothetical protein